MLPILFWLLLGLQAPGQPAVQADAAGKAGVASRLAQPMNPRMATMPR